MIKLTPCFLTHRLIRKLLQHWSARAHAASMSPGTLGCHYMRCQRALSSYAKLLGLMLEAKDINSLATSEWPNGIQINHPFVVIRAARVQTTFSRSPHFRQLVKSSSVLGIAFLFILLLPKAVFSTPRDRRMNPKAQSLALGGSVERRNKTGVMLSLITFRGCRSRPLIG